MTLARRQIAKLVSNQTGCTDDLAYRAVGALFDSMRETLLLGDRVEIRGFGTFEVKPTKGKPAARNPRTNEITPVPPHRLVRFRPGKIIREDMKKAMPS
jgi:nucleoid DNA-binding protein